MDLKGLGLLGSPIVGFVCINYVVENIQPYEFLKVDSGSAASRTLQGHDLALPRMPVCSSEGSDLLRGVIHKPVGFYLEASTTPISQRCQGRS
jgi:hypothetical protein